MTSGKPFAPIRSGRKRRVRLSIARNRVSRLVVAYALQLFFFGVFADCSSRLPYRVVADYNAFCLFFYLRKLAPTGITYPVSRTTDRCVASASY